MVASPGRQHTQQTVSMKTVEAVGILAYLPFHLVKLFVKLEDLTIHKFGTHHPYVLHSAHNTATHRAVNAILTD